MRTDNGARSRRLERRGAKSRGGHRCRAGGAAGRALDAGDDRGSTCARATPSAERAARALPSNCGEQHAAALKPIRESGCSTPSRKEGKKVIAPTKHRLVGLDLHLDLGLGGSAMQAERTRSVGWVSVRCARGGGIGCNALSKSTKTGCEPETVVDGSMLLGDRQIWDAQFWDGFAHGALQVGLLFQVFFVAERLSAHFCHHRCCWIHPLINAGELRTVMACHGLRLPG